MLLSAVAFVSLLAQQDLSELIEKLDSESLIDRDAAEEQLLQHFVRAFPLLTAHWNDERPEVRSRVRRLVGGVPATSLLRVLAGKDVTNAVRAARALADRFPKLDTLPEIQIPVCTKHYTLSNVAPWIAGSVPLVLLPSAQRHDMPLQPVRGKFKHSEFEEQANKTVVGTGLEWRMSGGFVALGSKEEIQEWKKQTSVQTLFLALRTRNPLARKLAAISLIHIRDENLTDALVSAADDLPSCGDAVLWKEALRSKVGKLSPAVESYLRRSLTFGPWSRRTVAAQALLGRDVKFSPKLLTDPTAR